MITQGFAAESASYFEATLQFQPGFEPAAERLQAVRCITLLKHIQNEEGEGGEETAGI
ncbi:hypothetical protein GBAR_LOCUS29943 [Geodia barretti]|uniref:Uncharacterized protein n=1 Tax=Geodia barretti TaxID=519541 RepID=A0AA35TW84_GEOBA|nr:hypothetical protein GBAR_LOCUS29943 [Geodia barretti]